MSKSNPFAKFEKSGKDKDPKGMKEGGKADKKLDSKQMGAGAGKFPPKKSAKK